VALRQEIFSSLQAPLARVRPGAIRLNKGHYLAEKEEAHGLERLVACPSPAGGCKVWNGNAGGRTRADCAGCLWDRGTRSRDATPAGRPKAGEVEPQVERGIEALRRRAAAMQKVAKREPASEQRVAPDARFAQVNADVRRPGGN